MTQKMFGWEMDKNIEDFFTVSNNMREEGHHSRADVIEYLITRVKIAECKLTRANDSLIFAQENIKNVTSRNHVNQDRIRDLLEDQPDNGWH